MGTIVKLQKREDDFRNVLIYTHTTSHMFMASDDAGGANKVTP